MVQFIKRLWKGEEGQGMVEYALIIGLVAVALILVIGQMTGGIDRIFTAIKDALDGAGPE